VSEPNPALLRPVDGPHRNFTDAQATEYQATQHIVWVPIALPHAIPIERFFRAAVHRHVPALGILQIYAKGLPRQQRKHVIAQPPMPRHGFARGGPTKPVAFHVVGVACDQRRQQRGKVRGVHLSVGRHYGSEIGPEQERVPATGRDRGANTLIGLVLDQLDRALDGSRDRRRRVFAPVVDDDDVVDESRNVLERGANQLRLVVGRHHDGDSSTCKHEPGYRLGIRTSSTCSAALCDVTPLRNG